MKVDIVILLAFPFLANIVKAQQCKLDLATNGCQIDAANAVDPFIAVCLADGVFEEDGITLSGKGKFETKCLQSSDIDKIQPVPKHRRRSLETERRDATSAIRRPGERGLKQTQTRKIMAVDGKGKGKGGKGSLLYDCQCCGGGKKLPTGVEIDPPEDGECSPIADPTQLVDACPTTQGGKLTGTNGCSGKGKGKGKGKGSTCDEVPACFDGAVDNDPVCVSPFASDEDLEKAAEEAGVPTTTPIFEVLPNTQFECGSNSPSTSVAPSLFPSSSPSESPTTVPSSSPSVEPSESLEPSITPSGLPSVQPSLSLAPSIATCAQDQFECGAGTGFFLVCLGEESDVSDVFSKFKSECLSAEDVAELEATDAPTAAPSPGGKGKAKGKNGKGGKGSELLGCGCCDEETVDGNNGSATGSFNVLGKGKGKSPDAGDFCNDPITVRKRRLSRGSQVYTTHRRQAEW